IKQTQVDWCCQHQGSLSQVYEEKREATQSDSNGVKPGPINKMVITNPRLNRLSEGGI
ncbi:hypothetical protein NFI96_020623, partial [Prochilodus magdalenae]